MSYLIISTIFILSGFIFKFYSPKSRNTSFGYRSTMSTKNQETWKIAQRYFGTGMIVIGILNFILGIFSVTYCLPINNSNFQLLVILLCSIIIIFLTEIRLRKLFDSNGTKKNSIYNK